MAIDDQMKKTNEKDEKRKAEQKAAIAKLSEDKSENVLEDRVMLVVFPVGGEEYAIKIDDIKEVVPAPKMAPIPQTEDFVLGVANVRGNVLAIIDLEIKFGLKQEDEEASNTENRFVIVINSEDVKVAVSSIQVPETLLIEKSKIDSSMDVLKKRSNEQGHIKGIVKIGDRMIILINILEMVKNEQVVR